MSRYRKVIWNEGMLLSPQHFQQWDNYYESLLNARLRSVMPYEWGVLDLQLSNEAVTNGKVELERCSAVMPDGLLVNVPRADAAPAPRFIEGHFPFDAETLDVYLAIPAKRAGAANYQANGGQPNQLLRYWQEAETVADEVTGRAEQQIAVAGNNLRLLFGDEPRDGYSAVKVVELARTTTGQVAISDKYVPPTLDIAASPWLINMLHEMVEILITKSSSLGEQRRQRRASLADFTTSEVAVFWLLHTVNSAIPTLSHLFRTHLVHPERLYVEMAELAGKLMTFVTDRHPKDIVRYDHTNLYVTFSRLAAELRFLLETVIPTRCVQIPLEKVRESLYAGRVEDRQLLDTAGFYLAVSAQVPEVQLIERVPRVIKVSSRDTIDIVIGSALPGVALAHASPPPAPVPVRPRFHYFALERHGVHWERIQGSKALAVYVPEEFSDEKVEMYAVKP